MQRWSDRPDVWNRYSSCAELLDAHNKGVIDLAQLPITWNFIEGALGEKLELVTVKSHSETSRRSDEGLVKGLVVS